MHAILYCACEPVGVTQETCEQSAPPFELGGYLFTQPHAVPPYLVM